MSLSLISPILHIIQLDNAGPTLNGRQRKVQAGLLVFSTRHISSSLRLLLLVLLYSSFRSYLSYCSILYLHLSRFYLQNSLRLLSLIPLGPAMVAPNLLYWSGSLARRRHALQCQPVTCLALSPLDDQLLPRPTAHHTPIPATQGPHTPVIHVPDLVLGHVELRVEHVLHHAPEPNQLVICQGVVKDQIQG